jgi:hypothetical protein
VLGARSIDEQQLGSGAHLAGAPVENDPSHLLAEQGPSGLTSELRPEVTRQLRCLGRFAGPLATLEDNQPPDATHGWQTTTLHT